MKFTKRELDILDQALGFVLAGEWDYDTWGEIGPEEVKRLQQKLAGKIERGARPPPPKSDFALDVPCPKCGAEAGKPCRSMSGRATGGKKWAGASPDAREMDSPHGDRIVLSGKRSP